MKLILATIQPERLEVIQRSLQQLDAYLVYVYMVGDVRDGLIESYRGRQFETPRPRLRVEIVVPNDMLTEYVIESISLGACETETELVAGTNVFVVPLDQWVRLPCPRHESPQADDTVIV